MDRLREPRELQEECGATCVGVRSAPSVGTPRLHALLVAADNPFRSHLAAFLEARGFRLITCSSVDTALTYRGPLHFALVALDVPGRPGWQLWNGLATDERAPLALFWGEDPSAWERLSLRTNNRTAFLQSPFPPATLLRALVELEQYRVERV